MLSETEIKEVLLQFPPVEFAFAYGSGAVEQGGYDYKQTPAKSLPMVDLILVVKDSEHWHSENMFRNPTHYSSLIPLSPFYTAAFQEKIKANFWFNAYVPLKPSSIVASSTSINTNERLMKYGVISEKDALRDLREWRNLYAAGRLHKPVHILQQNSIFQTAMKHNYDQAIKTSLLLLPERFTEADLFMTIASLSYIGDVRMFLGENPRKVSSTIVFSEQILTEVLCFIFMQVVNLVTPIVHHYHNLYKSTIEHTPNMTKINSFSHTYIQVNIFLSFRLHGI
jgi:translocator assembly and maintenance protein 41